MTIRTGQTHDIAVCPIWVMSATKVVDHTSQCAPRRVPSAVAGSVMNTPPLDIPRFDPLLLVHKAVRHVLFDVATQVGAVDASDIFAVDRCAKQVGRLLDMLPESASALVPLIDALYQRDTAARHVAAAALYREVTALVGAQLAAQQRAEADGALHAVQSDEELRDMRRAQLASMSEGELAEAVGSFGAALTPHELAAFLDDLQASVDGQTFACLSDTLRRRLDTLRWARVVRERGGDEEPPTGRRRGGAPGGAGSAKRRAPETTLQRRPHRVDRHRVRAQ